MSPVIHVLLLTYEVYTDTSVMVIYGISTGVGVKDSNSVLQPWWLVGIQLLVVKSKI